MRKNIYDKDLCYTLLKPIVDWNVKHSYRKVEVRGKENIPADGAVIIAPNHCNTLMDALVILRSFRDETVFGARADMFNNSFVAKLMYFVRILPMVRQRDGLRKVLKNYETQEIIVSTLKNKVRFCMFPEGKHRPAHSLQVLGKGTFRAALAANAEFGDKMPIYIVPTGIEYGDYFRYRSTSLVTFGEAINVTEMVKELDLDNEAQVIDHLRKELTARMSKLITYMEYDDNYAPKWALTKVRALGFKGSLYEKMMNNRSIVADIEKAYEEKPEEMQELFAKVNAFEKERRKKGVSIYSFGKKNLLMNVIGKGLTAVLGLPYLLFSGIVALPWWALAEFIRKKIRDKAFRNTAIFGVKLGGNITIGLAYIILAFCLLPWPWALAFLALWGPAYSYIYDYVEFTRRWISDINLLKNKKLQKAFEALK